MVLPGLMIAIGLGARRYADDPIRFTDPGGIAANCAVIVALVANEFTGGGATLFYAVTPLISAYLGQAGCEATVISNLTLGRNDQGGLLIWVTSHPY